MPRIKADPGYSEMGHSDEYKLEMVKNRALKHAKDLMELGGFYSEDQYNDEIERIQNLTDLKTAKKHSRMLSMQVFTVGNAGYYDSPR